MKLIGLCYISIEGKESLYAFKTPKRLFNFIAKRIFELNQTKFSNDVTLRQSWKIKKIPNGRTYTNLGVKILAKKTTFTKLQ